MLDNLLSGLEPWSVAVLVLVVGIALVTVLAALSAGRCSSAVWRRTIWRVTMLAVLVIVALEISGMPAAFLAMFRDAVNKATARFDEETPDDATRTADLVSRATPESTAWNPLSVRRFASPQRQTSGSGQRDFSLHDPPVYRQQPVSTAAILAVPAHQAAVDRRHGSDGASASPVPSAAPVASGNGAAGTVPLGTQTAAWWGVIWLLGAGCVLARLVARRWCLAWFCRTSRPLDDPALTARVRLLADRLNLIRHVRMVATRRLASPVAFGVLQPTVALPLDFGEQFDVDEQETILAHELAHLAAHDPAWHLLAEVACALVWWHPLVWWAHRQLATAGEQAADEASLLVPGGPDILAGCLIAVARRVAGRPNLGWLAVEGNRYRSKLGRRVERLLAMPARAWHVPRRRRILSAGISLLLAFVILSLSCTAWARPRLVATDGGSTMLNLLASSWRRSLAAAALATVLLPISGDTVVQAEDDRPKRDGEVREGDRPDGERRERGEGDRERGDADRPRGEGDRERGDADRPRGEGDRPRGDADRERGEGDRPRGERDRPRDEGDRERSARDREEGRRENRDREAAGGRHQEMRRHIEELVEMHNKLLRHAKEIEHRMRSLPDGQKDEAQRLKKEMHEIRARDAAIRAEIAKIEAAMRGDRPRDDRRERGEVAGDRQRRLRHLRVAAENLHAAGLHEAAQHVIGQIERLERGQPDGTPGERREGPHEQPDSQLRREVHNLHRQMEQMRKEMHGLHEALKHVIESRKTDR